MDGCLPVFLALWAYATLSEEAVPLTEGESDSEDKSDSIEGLATIRCLSRRPGLDQQGRANYSQNSAKLQRAPSPSKLEKHGHPNDSIKDEDEWRECAISRLQDCSSESHQICQPPKPCWKDSEPGLGWRRHQANVVGQEGDELELQCGGGFASAWIAPVGNDAKPSPLEEGTRLRFRSLEKKHSRRYTCRTKSERGRVLLTDITLLVQFPPEIRPLRVSQGGATLECAAIAMPPPHLTWLLDEELLLNDSETSARESVSEGCLQVARLRMARKNQSGAGDMRNYTCVASNLLGTASLSITGLAVQRTLAGASSNSSVVRDQDPLDGVPIKRFKITGFIIGMLPPLFISFYIILKLGYRSRYAEERPEETGMMEEPFFISN